ncbi:MAG: glucosaminidase domain-containing protein [Bacteroidota bacterium]
MKWFLRLLNAFMEGFLPVFGLVAGIGLAWYAWNATSDDFAGLPLIQEITDKYRLGWETTWAFGEDLRQRIVTFDSLYRAGEYASINTEYPQSSKASLSNLSIPWHRIIVERKLEEQNWSSGKRKAAGRYLDYIDQYLAAAVRDMYATGVSASITLAQGILESGAGRSNLALTTNNHFGIKALPTKEGRRKIKAKQYRELRDSDFAYRSPAIGVSQHHDDHNYDRFERYRNVGDSYRRHSALLLNTCKKARKGCYGWIWATFPVQQEPIDISAIARKYEPVSGYGPADFFGDTTVPYYAAQAAALKMAGYATSKTYHRKLVYLIETYELWRIDAALAQAARATYSDS